MNPLKKQNSFEEKLKENLDGMEFKPSDALWEKIAQNISSDGFEPKLQDKLQNYTVAPKSETWDQIENQLPEKKRRFAWFWISSILMMSALAGSIAYLQMQEKTASATLVQTETKIMDANTQQVSPLKSERVVKNEKVEAPVNVQVEKEIAAIDANEAPAKPLQKVPQNKIVLTQNASNHDGLTQAFAPKKSKGRNAAVPPNHAQNQSLNSIVPDAPKQQTSPLSKQTNEGIAPSSNETQNQKASKPEQSMVKEIASEKPPIPNQKIILDSQVVSPVAKSNVYMESDLDLSKLSIVATIGSHISFMHLSAPKVAYQNLDKALELRKEIEVPEIDFSANLSAEYAITEKLYVRAGIGILSFSQDVRYSLAKPDSAPNRTNGYNNYMHQSDSIVTGALYNTKNKYSFTEIPVWLGYKIARGEHWGIDLNVGMSYGKLNLVNAYIPDQSCIGLMVVSDKASFPTYKNMWFANIAPAATWQMNSMLDVGAMPQLRLGLNNMVGSDNWIGQKPWSVGLNIFLRKRF